MSKVKLVIEIDEVSYAKIKTVDGEYVYPNICRLDIHEGCEAIKNGTPLPEDFSLEDYERYKKDSESLSWIKYPDRMGN